MSADNTSEQIARLNEMTEILAAALDEAQAIMSKAANQISAALAELNKENI